jgi:hypothetical protein
MIDDLIAAASRPASGKRPQFCADPVVERLFGITLSLVTELSVTQQRLDALERVLARRATIDPGEVDAFVADGAAAAERAAKTDRYLATIFRAIIQDDAGRSAHADRDEAVLAPRADVELDAQDPRVRPHARHRPDLVDLPLRQVVDAHAGGLAEYLPERRAVGDRTR